jgi:anti-sigma factor (TIGR02949 family)
MSDGRCPDIDKYLSALRTILDNESTKEQEVYLMDHLEQCSCCLKEYELEKQVRELLRTKLKQKSVPSGLANSIKAKILQSESNVR